MKMKVAAYNVVDQNYLREPNPQLHSYLAAGNYVVFPDCASMESYKSDSLLNLRRSFEIVSMNRSGFAGESFN
jgi:hypothetical protein